ncbi:MAG: radical SAM family heme chaperone HemW [Eubacteriales bacterium]|nr:radical SAM family heme chaperone HemW [Eubacteriales bacterium]MDD4583870.1 radical SAM family heme chaperone HemW [Eubacteriales bacterium]
MRQLGLYVHIPFCVKKCRYCDFLSFAGIDNSVYSTYVKALLRDISHRNGSGFSVDSIFFGGGTPSLLEPIDLEYILAKIYQQFSVTPGAEISLEANPKTLSKSKLIAYRNLGINRISIGAQSMDDKLLDYIGRVHNSADFLENYRDARACGFKNINVDLMFALPGQTKTQWLNTLKQVIDLEPEHISFYSLQLEKGTPFYQMFEAGTLKEMDDETDRQMYWEGVYLLEKCGYFHYEISNAAKFGYKCRHNLKYWSMEEYLGLGLGAHSYVDGKRFSNETDLDTYIQSGDGSFIVWKHTNTYQDEISEFIFTGLRKIEGISLKKFEQKFGISLIDIYKNEVNKHIQKGLLEIDPTDHQLRFTRKGIDLSNTVLIDFV